MSKDEQIPAGFEVLDGGKLWPLGPGGSHIPTPLQARNEKILKETIARNEAGLNAPLKSFNTLERERLTDEANARALARTIDNGIER